MSALRCPQCRAVYAEPARFCTRDGAALEPKEEASDLPGTVLDERFEVRHQIGEGGMAAVFLAADLTTGADVAVKVLAPGFYARQNIRTTVKIAIVTLLATQAMNAVLIVPLRHAADDHAMTNTMPHSRSEPPGAQLRQGLM